MRSFFWILKFITPLMQSLQDVVPWRTWWKHPICTLPFRNGILFEIFNESLLFSAFFQYAKLIHQIFVKNLQQITAQWQSHHHQDELEYFLTAKASHHNHLCEKCITYSQWWRNDFFCKIQYVSTHSQTSEFYDSLDDWW